MNNDTNNEEPSHSRYSTVVDKLYALAEANQEKQLIEDIDKPRKISREVLINTPTSDGRLLMNIVAKNNNSALAKKLVERGADASKLQPSNLKSALFVACERGSLNFLTAVTCEWLFYTNDKGKNLLVGEKNCAIIKQCMEELPYLHAAVENQRTEVVKFLLRDKISPNKIDRYGRTALFIAASNDDVEMCNLLLSYRASIDEDSLPLLQKVQGFSIKGNFSAENVSLLYIAFRFEDYNYIRFLLENTDSSLQERCDDGYVFELTDNNIILNLVLHHLGREQLKQLINNKDVDGNNAAHRAVITNSYIRLRFLIENDVDINAQNNNGYTPLHYAIERQLLPIVDILLEYGARTDIKNANKETAIKLIGSYSKAYTPNLEEILIYHNVNLSFSLFKHMIKMLGCRKLHFKSDEEDTCMVNLGHLATQQDNAEAVEFLLKYIPANRLNSEDQNQLHLVKSFKVAEILVNSFKEPKKLAAALNAQDKNGYTPLYYIAFGGNTDICELYLANGAELNVKSTKNGLTPLHCAALSGNQKTYSLLIKNGAIPRLDNSDKLPQDYAKETGIDISELSGEPEAAATVVPSSQARRKELHQAFSGNNTHPAIGWCQIQ